MKPIMRHKNITLLISGKVSYPVYVRYVDSAGKWRLPKEQYSILSDAIIEAKKYERATVVDASGRVYYAKGNKTILLALPVA